MPENHNIKWNRTLCRIFFLQEIIKIPESRANEHPARSQKKHECNCGIIYCISSNYHLSMLEIKQCCWAQHQTRTAHTLVHQLLCAIQEEHSFSHILKISNHVIIFSAVKKKNVSHKQRGPHYTENDGEAWIYVFETYWPKTESRYVAH
jgi:hypothetical protein